MTPTRPPLPASAGPRPTRHPRAIASALDLIGADDRLRLRDAVCAHGSPVLMQVDRGEAFWTTTWPRLVRQSLEMGSWRCAAMLLGLMDARDLECRPAPAHALGWLLKGEQARRDPAKGTDPALGFVRQRLAQGPVRLRTADGMRLVEMGGVRWALAQTLPAPDAATPATLFHEAPAVHAAWHRWRCRPAHQRAVVALLGRRNSPVLVSDGARVLEDMVEGLPEAERDRLLQLFCDALDANGAAGDATSQAIGWMGGWLQAFTRNGWSLGHPVWARWGRGLGQALLDPALASTLVHDWVSVLLYMHQDLQAPPPGLAWSPMLAEALALARAPTALAELMAMEEHRKGLKSNAGPLPRLSAWAHETLDLEARLVGWGQMDRQARVHWRASIDRAMGPDWKARMEDLLRGAVDPSHPLQRHWRAWLASSLELSIPAGPGRASARM